MRPPVRISAAWKTTNVQPEAPVGAAPRARRGARRGRRSRSAPSAEASPAPAARETRSGVRAPRRAGCAGCSRAAPASGKPWRAIQRKFGRKSSPATAPPIQIPGFANARRAGVSSRPDDDGETEDERRLLVEQAEAHQRAEPDPQPVVARLDPADHAERRAHPEERLERVHRQEVVDAEVDRRHQDRERRQALRVPASARARARAAPRARPWPRPPAAGSSRRPRSDSPNTCRANHAIAAMSGGWST